MEIFSRVTDRLIEDSEEGKGLQMKSMEVIFTCTPYPPDYRWATEPNPNLRLCYAEAPGIGDFVYTQLQDQSGDWITLGHDDMYHHIVMDLFALNIASKVCKNVQNVKTVQCENWGT